jgi:hypothetical protein
MKIKSVGKLTPLQLSQFPPTPLPVFEHSLVVGHMNCILGLMSSKQNEAHPIRTVKPFLITQRNVTTNFQIHTPRSPQLHQ